MIWLKKIPLQINGYLGIDNSIFWATINKLFGIVRAPVTIYFLVRFLSVEQQGLWYTFASLGALTMLADLGFTSIITQFVSHEYANLQIRDGKISGSADGIDRLMGLIKFSASFYLKVTAAAVLLLAMIGLWYFRSQGIYVYLAWIMFSFTGGISLLVCLFQTIYQGLDKMKEIQINLLLNSFIITLFTCLALYLNFEIWALVIGILVGLIMTSLGLFLIAKPFWIQVYNYKVFGKYNFFQETFSLQIRYAVSFICSYIISYLFVPATFKYIGAIAAGQLGLTISIVAVISGISNTWLFTKVPKFNICVSRRQFKELDHLLKSAVIQGLFIQILLSGIFILGLFIINNYFEGFYNRFLDIKLSILFLGPQIVQFVITGLTLYLRAFKKEPLMWLQIINALLIVTSVGAILYNGLGLTVLFYTLNIISWFLLLPIALFVFKKKRMDFTNGQV